MDETEARRRASIKNVNEMRLMDLFDQRSKLLPHEPDEVQEFMKKGKRLNVKGVHLRLDRKNYPVDTDPQLTLCGLNADAEGLCFYVTEPGSKYDLPTMIDLADTCEKCRDKAKNIMRMIALAGTSV